MTLYSTRGAIYNDVTGIDVLVMKGDKIGAVYTFVDPPKK
jgi:hypothetical protein